MAKYKKIVLPEDSVQSSSETVSQCVSGKDFLIHKAPLLTFFLSKIVHWYFVSKILGSEFAKRMRLLEQFILTEYFFEFLLDFLIRSNVLEQFRLRKEYNWNK